MRDRVHRRQADEAVDEPGDQVRPAETPGAVESLSHACTVFVVPGDATAVLRIGELSRRLGVSEHVLRAWERRYGLLQPQRAPGGYRLYSMADENRVRQMQAYLAQGLSAAEAARAALDRDAASSPTETSSRPHRQSLAVPAAALSHALDDLDEPAAQAVLDRLFAEFTVEAVLRDVVLPYLRELGERWRRGAVTVTEEHFASNLLRGRLDNLARGWGRGYGPQALLACAPGELHDLPLLAFGIVLHRNGWRVRFLGADTPLAELTGMAVRLRPDLVVLTATTSDRLDGRSDELARLARLAPLALAGAGATHITAGTVGARLLKADPVTAAEQMPPPDRPGHGPSPHAQHDQSLRGSHPHAEA